MMIGYARAASPGAELDHQIELLRDAGCARIFTDTTPARMHPLPPDGLHLVPMSGIHQILFRIGEGDVLVVCRLDRVGRSLSFVIDLINWLADYGASLRSLAEQIDSGAPEGIPVLRLTRALAEAGRILADEPQGEADALALDRIARGRAQQATREETLARLAWVLNVDRASLDRAARGYRHPEADE
jgi:DNA invertase Pin-like site-specific DNA recombinase